MFSYFFNGYKADFFLWEFAILWRKISIIGITLMMANHSFTIQILMAVAVMMLFMII